MLSPACMFTFADVLGARARLRGVARRTPLVAATDLAPGCTLYLKAENLQRTHAFKFRGAYNRASLLSEAERARGLVTASSGNHALGLSLAGAALGARVTVVMPHGAPEVKAQGCTAYGATVVRYGGAYDDALRHARDLEQQRGMTYVPSFDDPYVAAGQATVAWEVIEDLPDVDLIVAPIGGGGLLSGVAGLVKAMSPDQTGEAFPLRPEPLSRILVVGVQAEGAASMVASVSVGKVTALSSVDTVADGIAVRSPGAWTYEAVSAFADDLVTVSDQEMLDTMAALLLREKLLVEPAGAASVAAVIHGKAGGKVDLGAMLSAGAKIACVLSGGNVEPGLLRRALGEVAAT